MLRVLALSAALGGASARDLSLTLTKVNQTTSRQAKCIDGTAPAHYWRNGVADGAKSAVLFLEGGGWCYPCEVLQSTGGNCAYRAKRGLGSSKGYGPSIASMGYEGGTGYTSGLPNVTKWANWATAYVKYCNGGSVTGTRATSTPARNGTGPLWYRGHYNIVAQLDSMVATKGLANCKEIILSGCSAGGLLPQVRVRECLLCEALDPGEVHLRRGAVPRRKHRDRCRKRDAETVPRHRQNHEKYAGALSVMPQRGDDVAAVYVGKHISYARACTPLTACADTLYLRSQVCSRSTPSSTAPCRPS